MTRLRAGALLGGLSLVAIVLLAGVVRAQLFPVPVFGHQYLQTVTKACDDATNKFSTVSITTECHALADALDRTSGDSLADFARPIANAALKFFKDSKVKDKCDACIQATGDFESSLATNGVAQGLSEAFTTACFEEFQDPEAQNACIATAQQIPTLICATVTNVPPDAACRAAGLCPL